MFNFQAIDLAVSRAALDPSYWVTAMDAVADATESAGAVLLPLHGRHPGLPYSESIAPMMEQYFAEGWHARDERTKGLYLFDRQKSFGDLDLLSPEQIAKLPYYQDLMGRHGLRWFGGIIVSSGEESWCICIQRTIAQGPFSNYEIAALGSRSAGLSGAVALASALGYAQSEATLNAMDASASAVVLLDRFGKFHKANGSAEILLQEGALKLANGRLVAQTAGATANLERALSALLWATTPDALVRPVVLPRLDGRRSVLAYPVRMPALDANPFGPARAAVVLRDLDAEPIVPIADLRNVFQLTLAEAKLTQLLVAGKSLDQSAHELDIEKSTARVHLKSIFSKTGSTRQSELLLVISRFLRPGRQSYGNNSSSNSEAGDRLDVSDVARAGASILDGRAGWRGRFR